MIKLNNVNKQYDKNVIFKDFNIIVEDGEMIAILGKSGAGKSTLLNILGLLEKPDSGDIVIDKYKNPNLNSLAATKLRRNTIGYLFQNYALIDNKTVNENLDVALEYSNLKDKKSKNIKKTQVLKELGLADKLNTKIYKLSGGEQQRVAIARLMLKPCNIILADEPTGSLDKDNRDIVIELLKRLNSMNKTIIIVTHDKQVADSCSKTITL